jgi:hypothetical protein
LDLLFNESAAAGSELMKGRVFDPASSKLKPEKWSIGTIAYFHLGKNA